MRRAREAARLSGALVLYGSTVAVESWRETRWPPRKGPLSRPFQAVWLSLGVAGLLFGESPADRVGARRQMPAIERGA
jgi:hypothetical protein